jgi:hypothetical protein
MENFVEPKPSRKYLSGSSMKLNVLLIVLHDEKLGDENESHLFQ